ncbi:MAG: hypothetical protein KKA07_11200 [Bacteroidetes bacterium]|nr:hypothetical protein [Bacteroidota bacterium]
MNQLISGNDDISVVLDIYLNSQEFTGDSLDKLIDVSNQNYLEKDTNRKSEPDLQFRQIYFNDQYFRIKCYIHRIIPYDVVKRNDSILQTLFLGVTNKYVNLDLFRNEWYQKTFDLLLTHSVGTNTGFFENNFFKYSSPFSNDFVELEGLRQLLDLYLNFRFGKQYFGTEFGKGRLNDGTFGMQPQMPEFEFRGVLKDLSIIDAKY